MQDLLRGTVVCHVITSSQLIPRNQSKALWVNRSRSLRYLLELGHDSPLYSGIGVSHSFVDWHLGMGPQDSCPEFGRAPPQLRRWLTTLVLEEGSLLREGKWLTLISVAESTEEHLFTQWWQAVGEPSAS